MASGAHKLSNFEVGQVHKSQQGSEFTIVEIINRNNIVIEFNDNFKFRYSVRSVNLATGEINNPYFPSISGVGYLGVGNYACSDYDENGVRTPAVAYTIWKEMIQRCYNEVRQETQPSYKGCSVNLIWHCYQNFAYWYYNNPYHQKGWHLDKDIIVRGNKEYGPLRCAFVPREVNYLMRSSSKERSGEYPVGVNKHSSNGKFVARISKAGGKPIELIQTYNLEEAVRAYKLAKEEYLYSVGEKWQGLIDQRVVDSLKNWTVREDD